MRVLISGYRSKPYVGGQGVYIYHLSKVLLELGHNVTIASGPPYPELVDGIELIKIPSLDLIGHPSPLAQLKRKHLQSWADITEWFAACTGAFGEPYSFGRRLRQYLLENGHQRFDILHDNQTFAYDLLEIKKDGLPVTATLHHPITIDKSFDLAACGLNLGRRMLKQRWYNFLPMQAHVASEMDRLISVSEASLQDAAHDFGLDPARAIVSPNGVDYQIFSPGPFEAREKDLLVTTASADVPLKGLAVLITALVRLIRTRPQLRLKVIGRLREGHAAELIRRYGLRDRVEFAADLTSQQMADEFRRATVVVCPSLYEGFGMPAAEAMATGAPVVASAAGGLSEVVGSGGMLVRPGDANVLASTLDQFLDDPNRRQKLGELARERATALFSWEQHARDCVRVYEDVIEHAYHTA